MKSSEFHELKIELTDRIECLQCLIEELDKKLPPGNREMGIMLTLMVQLKYLAGTIQCPFA